ncbi:hypothetical protein K8R33_05100 [archaeon]|nr:hypothetical protein [archaeon]
MFIGQPLGLYVARFLGYDVEKRYLGASCLVLKVREQGNEEIPFIIKVARDGFSQAHILRDGEALEMLDGIEDVPEILFLREGLPDKKRYGLRGLYCLGKERILRFVGQNYPEIPCNEGPSILVRGYVTGPLLSEKGVRLDSKAEARLEETVKRIHQAGIARLDLEKKPQNVLIGLDGSPRLFEFGKGIFRGEASNREFGKLCYKDRCDLERLSKYND